MPLWWGGVLNLCRCVNGTEGGSNMAMCGFEYGCMWGCLRWYCVGAVFLNLDRGVHLGGDNYSFLLFQILAAF